MRGGALLPSGPEALSPPTLAQGWGYEIISKITPKRYKMKKTIIFLTAISLFSMTPKEYQQKLGLGIDVNWASFKKYIKHEYYKKAGVFKKLGFDTVRIRFTDPEKFRMSQKEYLKFLKKCVNTALENRLIPVLTYTNKNFLNDPQKYMDKSVEIWKKVAAAFKNYPDIVSYDLYIEPAKKLNKDKNALLEFYKKSIEAIRKIDKDKIIFIAPNHASNPYYLDILTPLIKSKPKNLMIEWHYYAAGPSKTNKKKLWTTGTKEEKKLIYNKAKFAKEWCNNHGLYSWVGAVMPGNYNKGDYYSQEDQIKFIKTLIDVQKEFNIPFAINADGQFYDYKKDKIRRKKVLKFIVDYYKSLKN